MQVEKIFFLLFILNSISLFSFDRDTHNYHLNKVLFIDQYNGSGTYLLDELKAYGIQNVPTKEQIDFSSNQYHQRYTHRGWDFKNYPNQTLFETRKSLLLSTLDKLFNFQENEQIKRDSFGALLYYIHVIGDHIGDDKKTYTTRMRLNGSMRGLNMDRLDIIWELEYHIPRLFQEQANSLEYKTLMKYLEKRGPSPKFIYATTISDDEYKKLQDFANEILNKLIENIPALLKNEPFFVRVFY